MTRERSDLLSHRYHARLQEAVTRAVNSGATTLTDLCQRCGGAFPTAVFDVAREIVGEGVNQWPHRRWPEDALGTEDGAVPSMPEPHPIDFEWRYTGATADEITAILSSKGGRIGCFGTPSVFMRLVNRELDAVLFDRNPGLRRHFPTTVHTRMRTFDLSQPLSVAAKWQAEATRNQFDVILLDPPWYVGHTLAWLAQALVRLRSQGRIVLTLFPELVRPGADVEREQLLEVFRSLGDVHLLDAIPRYTTPIFESETLSAFGLADLGQWRSGELLEITVSSDASYVIDAPVIQEPMWERVQLGRQVVAVRHNSSTRHLPLSVRPAGNNGSFLLRSVSARDPVREHVTLWTSRNRAASVSGTDIAVRFLTAVATGDAPGHLISTEPFKAESPDSLNTLLALVGW